ncbi:hypothetical protein VTK73DRAFT_1423 [Phialemonium thermophilum]|uniref:Uncharacterized protein n=1 Tax=Phialemonium thermophilum TaxID=223376 RepID=A0ABR3VTJ7_9PEZI
MNGIKDSRRACQSVLRDTRSRGQRSRRVVSKQDGGLMLPAPRTVQRVQHGWVVGCGVSHRHTRSAQSRQFSIDTLRPLPSLVGTASSDRPGTGIWWCNFPARQTCPVSFRAVRSGNDCQRLHPAPVTMQFHLSCFTTEEISEGRDLTCTVSVEVRSQCDRSLGRMTSH